jgi:hypothetical protein
MTPADRELTTNIVRSLIAAAGDRARRAVVFGSRARETATPDSDVDLLLLLELPVGARWTPRDNILERNRLLATLPRPTVPSIELWVRTIDQFEEAKAVPGAVEHAAATQGVTVYDRPLTRRPAVRRSRALVRAQNVADWIGGALQLLQRADDRAQTLSVDALANTMRAPSSWSDRGEGAGALAARATRWGYTAILVLNDQPPPDKREPLPQLRRRLDRFEPGLARRLHFAGAGDIGSVAATRTALREITSHLQGHPRMTPLGSARGASRLGER